MSNVWCSIYQSLCCFFHIVFSMFELIIDFHKLSINLIKQTLLIRSDFFLLTPDHLIQVIELPISVSSAVNHSTTVFHLWIFQIMLLQLVVLQLLYPQLFLLLLPFAGTLIQHLVYNMLTKKNMS